MELGGRESSTVIKILMRKTYSILVCFILMKKEKKMLKDLEKELFFQ